MIDGKAYNERKNKQVLPESPSIKDPQTIDYLTAAMPKLFF
jgi:hypothetical protein